MGTEGGDKCVDNVDKLRKKWWGGEKGTNPEEVWLLRGGGWLKRDGSESGLQHQEAATWAGQLWS